MEFHQTEIKRAIRDFEKTIYSLQSAGYEIYSARVKELINLVTQNKVLSYIINPYLLTNVDFDYIENVGVTGRFDLRLPEDKDLQIAYVFQLMKRATDENFSVEDYAFRIFASSRISDNISQWNYQILFPCLENLKDKLSDLIEDEVEGKDKVSAASLQIINYGSITAKNGNVALGQVITQTLSTGELSNDIIKKALEQGIISEEQVETVSTITDEIETELQQGEPSLGKLEQLAGHLYDIGSKGLLGLTTSIITDTKWIEAVNTFLFGLI
ncbi:hypothetical protein BAMA_12545 [Bacillus manliponensis]|uniref:AbiTii domain-containing protein n=1 Tax=Bacillus manliponensis TaxID=574376 RepID=A0A073K5M8_9BACI|nr:hypothetical protein [Bacillus manliponensis]KEK17558.1 hypothetical protein BAMA_12545 [Bacillus manliponensis]